MIRDTCDHCANEILPGTLVEAKSGVYCCIGCRIVRENLLDNGMGEFYEFRNTPLERVGNSLGQESKFSYLDDEQFQSEKLLGSDGRLSVRFFIEGARCQACLWILEQIPERLDYVDYSRFSLDKSVLEIGMPFKSKLSEVASLIQSYGYKAHLVLEDSKALELKRKAKRAELIRLGVSFACAGNIMLLSFSAYAGLEGELRRWFDYASLILCLPVISYGALPFYRSTIGFINSRQFSIDVSVAFGIVLGFVASAIHVIQGKGDVYFDTISMLVFLLLGSRFLLDSARDKGMNSSEARSFFSHTSAKKLLKNGDVKEVHSSLLVPGDVMVIERGDTILADGEIIDGVSYINESALTGESFPVRKNIGDMVFAGSENQSESIQVKVIASSSESKMGRILEKLQSNWGRKTKLSRISDSFSKKIVIVVTLLALGVYIYFHFLGRPEIGFQRALAMIIITCPCALGFNIPLAVMIGMRKLARFGIILKDDSVVENVKESKHVFLDKTGTITSGSRDIKLEWTEEPEANVLYSLELRSVHPLGKEVVAAIKAGYDVQEVELEDFHEVPGSGPRAKYNGDEFSIRPLRSENTSFGLFKNEKLILKANVVDELDVNFSNVVDYLTAKGKKVFLLSGDSKQRVLKASKSALGKIERSFYEVSPEDKEKIVNDYSKSVMLGDGVNDALALKNASVGIAANGGVDLALSSSDIYFCSGGLESLRRLYQGCDQIVSILKTNVFIALLYNIIFIFLAMIGFISPFSAAVLMPLSSLTLLGVSFFMLSRLDRVLRK
ncbi:MAG: hypothetical protein CME64_05220 [Halobacteriovoraceae bacterium]|nr:hypothetical protein [Halobacteriovoraceae bacterium]|tara:strand:- start:62664 stop:65015 length:2352 start_codon:yes stop_codon:yes gene_type:complete